ncbi:putative ubiquitin hydrolase [Trypanosoma grayi]|uniref:putative ubiquitin hydrolase n=1 Tax=Trypanosoma grayi TaxID=71804 RepID=UPI0004F44306|nr:putative ubiquitin hydrolase [Trypanosoma grayi]KEG11501.1 putative ubiquitin hydrolase [Trypanosoma grayi]
MICGCIGRVKPERLRAVFANHWLKDGVASLDPIAMLCYQCERRDPSKSEKKKGFFAMRGIFKKSDSRDATRKGSLEDMWMCLTCTLCFCTDHAKIHCNMYARPFIDHPRGTFSDSNSTRDHTIFLGIPSGVPTQGEHTSPEKNKSVFPMYCVDGIEQMRGNAPLTEDEESGLLYRLCNEEQEWVYNVWCMLCSEKPAQLSASNYSEALQTHLCVKRLGVAVAKLLYLFQHGVAVDLRIDGTASTPESTTLGGTASRARAGADPHGDRGRLPGPDLHSSQVSSMVTSSTRGRNIERETELMASAHIAGIENVQNTCYFNSVLQCVLKCEFFTRPLLSLSGAALPGPLSRRLQDMIHHLRKETAEDVRRHAAYPYARAVLQSVCDISSMFAEDDQQDCQELFLCMINGVADEFDKGKTEKQKKKGPRLSFEGSVRTEVTCTRCSTHFPREETFMALSIPVEDSIECGLRKLFAPGKLREKDQYACEVCFKRLSKEEQELHNAAIRAENEKKDKAKKKAGNAAPAEEKKSLNCIYADADVKTSISRLGGTLALHLLRFHVEGRDFHKLARRVAFPMTLDLSPFVSEEVLREHRHMFPLPASEKRWAEPRGSSGACSNSNNNNGIHMLADQVPLEVEQLHNAEGCEDAGRTATKASASAHLPGVASAHQVSGDTGDEGSLACASLTSSAATTTVNINAAATAENNITNGEVKEQEPLPSLQRELVGIVTHRGSLHGGHYMAFVRNRNNPDTWFCCDDECIEIVEKGRVLQCQAEVYMLFYE